MSDQSAPDLPERYDRRRNKTPLEVSAFQGLDNTNPPEGLPFAALTEAINCHIDDTGMLITRRDGSLVSAGVFDAYGLRGLPFYALVGTNREMATYSSLTHELIRSLGGVGYPPYRWCGCSGASIFLQSLGESWEIFPTHIRRWGVDAHPGPASIRIEAGGSLRGGHYHIAMTYLEVSTGREGGAMGIQRVLVPEGGKLVLSTAQADHQIQVYLSVADGPAAYRAYQMQAGDEIHISNLPRHHEDGTAALAEPLETLGMYPPPLGECIACWDNRALVGVVDAPADASAIYWSQPFQYHLFRIAEDYLTVPGQVRALAASPEGLVIGTDRAVWLMRMDEELQPLILVGVPPGNAVDWDNQGTLYLQTHRGPARVGSRGLDLMANTVTDDYTGVAALAVVEEGGFERLVVAYEDGRSDIFNPLE